MSPRSRARSVCLQQDHQYLRQQQGKSVIFIFCPHGFTLLPGRTARLLESFKPFQTSIVWRTWTVWPVEKLECMNEYVIKMMNMKWRMQWNDRLLSKTQPFERCLRPAWDLLRTMRQRRLFPDVYACRGLNWRPLGLGSPLPHSPLAENWPMRSMRPMRSMSFRLQGNMVIGALAPGGSWEKMHLERGDQSAFAVK